MKVIYSGLESSGKSLKLAKVARNLVLRNSKWNKLSGKNRFISSNMRFSPSFERFASSHNVRIVYWSNYDDLVNFVDCDVIIDEVGTYFDSRGWENLDLNVRRWLAQAAKLGVEIYGSAQDFAQVDKSFRRLTNKLFHITKIIGSRRPSATKPPVTFVWGVCVMRELNPQGYDEEKSKFKPVSLLPSFFTIDKDDCDIFDTGQQIERSKPLNLKHEERFCLDCGFVRKTHS